MEPADIEPEEPEEPEELETAKPPMDSKEAANSVVKSLRSTVLPILRPLGDTCKMLFFFSRSSWQSGDS